MRYLITTLLLCVTSACSTITPLGPNTYAIKGGTSVVASRAKAVCDKEGKVVLVTNFDSANEFIFKCLDKDDPEYKDYEYESVPDTVIEDKR